MVFSHLSIIKIKILILSSCYWWEIRYIGIWMTCLGHELVDGADIQRQTA